MRVTTPPIRFGSVAKFSFTFFSVRVVSLDSRSVRSDFRNRRGRRHVGDDDPEPPVELLGEGPLDAFEVVQAIVAQKDAEEVRDERKGTHALDDGLEHLRLLLHLDRRAGKYGPQVADSRARGP